MTPLTFTRSATLPPTLPDPATALARQPLIFNGTGHCTNQSVLAAVISVLSDKSSPDQLVADIIQNAVQHQYQYELSRIIHQLRALHGPDAVPLSDHNLGLLSPQPLVHKNMQRHQTIDSALACTLPTSLTQLISEYDEELEISPRNESLILNSLQSTNQLAKNLIICAASHQNKIPYLNTLLEKVRMQIGMLNLSDLDLSNLDLGQINLIYANLSFTDLQDCNLREANLHGALLFQANLNGANLDTANLTYARLIEARLIGASMKRAIMPYVVLQRAVLKFANLTGADLGGNANLRGAWLDHATLNNANLKNADLGDTSFSHAKMHGTNLDLTDLSGANFSYTSLRGNSMLAVNVTNTNFSYATLNRVIIKTPSKLTHAVWIGASFNQILSDDTTMQNMPTNMWMHCTSK